tara:strand:- start:1824 stop:1985 length:162 start_codon:yes stop_codon:yes gene_type:complete
MMKVKTIEGAVNVGVHHEITISVMCEVRYTIYSDGSNEVEVLNVPQIEWEGDE